MLASNVTAWVLAVVAFGVLVMVHELGHFAVARLFGVKVEAFSIGFGPVLWKRMKSGTEFRLSAVPLGGYCKMAGEIADDDDKVYPADEFMGKPWWVRSLVLLAGPGMNFIFPIVALALLYATLGKPVLNGPALVKGVMQGKPAAAAGLQPGDRILRVGGEDVAGYALLSDLVDKSARKAPGKPLSFGVKRGTQALDLSVTPAWDESAKGYRIGVLLDAAPPPQGRVVDRVTPGLPAEKAGLRKGDEILEVGGQPLKDGRDFAAFFAQSKADPVPMAVSRAGQVITLTAAQKQPIPEGTAKPEEVGLLGLELVTEAQVAYYKLGPLKGPLLAAVETVDLARAMVKGIWDLITVKVAFREAVGGPITIMRMAKQQAESGLIQLLDFASKISVMLCVMNLLPIPLLDGGTLLACVVEGVRRKRLSVKALGVLQYVGLVLLGLIFVAAFYNDIANLVAPLWRR